MCHFQLPPIPGSMLPIFGLYFIPPFSDPHPEPPLFTFPNPTYGTSTIYTMAGFGAGFRSSSSSSDYLRGAEMDLTLRDIAARYLGTDWFSRDENVRRDGLRSAAAHGGFGDRDGWSMEEAVRIDDVRR